MRERSLLCCRRDADAGTASAMRIAAQPQHPGRRQEQHIQLHLSPGAPVPIARCGKRAAAKTRARRSPPHAAGRAHGGGDEWRWGPAFRRRSRHARSALGRGRAACRKGASFNSQPRRSPVQGATPSATQRLRSCRSAASSNAPEPRATTTRSHSAAVSADGGTVAKSHTGISFAPCARCNAA